MKEFWIKHIKLLLVLLATILIIISIFSILGRFFPEERQDLAPSHLIQVFRNNHGSLTVNDVGLIKSWMTFDYINKLFKLPPEYLKMQLAIADTRYPRISIRSFAKNNNMDINIFLLNVEQEVRNYLVNEASKTLATTSTQNSSSSSQ